MHVFQQIGIVAELVEVADRRALGKRLHGRIGDGAEEFVRKTMQGDHAEAANKLRVCSAAVASRRACCAGGQALHRLLPGGPRGLPRPGV